MNDDQFEALDDRAKTAASNVQAAAQRRTRPAFDADRTTTLPQPAAVGQARAPRRTAWIAAAAVVALVAGAVTFAVTRPDDGNDTVTAAATNDPRPFVADDLPDGLEPLWFVNMDQDSGIPQLSSRMPVYGETTERPLAGATVLDVNNLFDELELTAFDDDGLTLYRGASNMFSPGTSVMVKQEGANILVLGASENDAIALAHAVTAVDGEVSVDVEALPDEWERLATVDDPLTTMFRSMSGSTSVRGYFAAYMAKDTFESLQIASVAADEPAMWAGRLFVPGSREVTVRGQRGFVGSYPVPEEMTDPSAPENARLSVVSWLERPGELITVSGLNLSEDELLAAAEGIRPAEEQDWDELVEQAQLGEFGSFGYGGDELGKTTGTFEDGTKWSLSVVQSVAGAGADGGTEESYPFTDLRVAVGGGTSSGDGGSSSGSSSAGGVVAFHSVETFDRGGRHFASGIITEDVDRVQLQRADGTVLGDTTVVEVAGYRAFVTELTEDPTWAVALRADGSELRRVVFEDLDQNVTTSMDGEDGASQTFHDEGESTTFEGQGTPVDSEGNPIPDPVQTTETSVPTDELPHG